MKQKWEELNINRSRQLFPVLSTRKPVRIFLTTVVHGSDLKTHGMHNTHWDTCRVLLGWLVGFLYHFFKFLFNFQKNLCKRARPRQCEIWDKFYSHLASSFCFYLPTRHVQSSAFISFYAFLTALCSNFFFFPKNLITLQQTFSKCQLSYENWRIYYRLFIFIKFYKSYTPDCCLPFQSVLINKEV